MGQARIQPKVAPISCLFTWPQTSIPFQSTKHAFLTRQFVTFTPKSKIRVSSCTSKTHFSITPHWDWIRSHVPSPWPSVQFTNETRPHAGHQSQLSSDGLQITYGLDWDLTVWSNCLRVWEIVVHFFCPVKDIGARLTTAACRTKLGCVRVWL